MARRCWRRPRVCALFTAAVLVLACDGGPIEPSARGRLVFAVQPSRSEGAQPISPAVQVAILDAVGDTMETATHAVTVAWASNPNGATLFGTTTVNAVRGRATFADLRVDRPGAAYALVASAVALPHATSEPFAVGLTFAQVSSGGDHTCGVTTSRAAYCWGKNNLGQLGDGTTIDHPSPVLVQGGVSFTQASAGYLHSCGVALGGTTYCWGTNFGGELGDGTTTSRSTPGLVHGGLTLVHLSAGFYGTCGVTDSGAAYCWGGHGLQEGNGSSRSPVLVPGGMIFTMMSVGDAHTCGVTTTGTAHCWGNNLFGQVGDGTVSDTFYTTPVLVGGGRSFGQVSAGDFFTCGLTTDGTAYCWGENGHGNLGDGTTTNRTNPTLVMSSLDFAQLTAGTEYACGIENAGAVGPALCWGDNSYGEVGDGSLNRLVVSPVLVLGDLTFAHVSAGRWHTCGVTSNGVAYCWGRNESGQLGDGTQVMRLSPVAVVQ
jgi:alpha-tubulin suppressor-like RCC1 family protein